MAINPDSLIGMAQTVIGIISKSHPVSDDYPISDRLVAEAIRKEIDILNHQYIEQQKYEPIDQTLLTPICISLSEKNASECPCVTSCKTLFVGNLPTFTSKLGLPIITYIGHPDITDTSTTFIAGKRPASITRFSNQNNEYYYQIIGNKIYIDRPKKSLLCSILIIGHVSDSSALTEQCLELEAYPALPHIRAMAITNVIAKFGSPLSVNPNSIIDTKNNLNPFITNKIQSN